jgi:hypothetical protein
MKESLGEVFGCLVGASLTAQVAIYGFPIAYEKQFDEGAIPVGFVCIDIVDKRPVGRQESLTYPSHLGVILLVHNVPGKSRRTAQRT